MPSAPVHYQKTIPVALSRQSAVHAHVPTQSGRHVFSPPAKLNSFISGTMPRARLEPPFGGVLAVPFFVVTSAFSCAMARSAAVVREGLSASAAASWRTFEMSAIATA